MEALLDVILPVFLVIGFGYVACRGSGWFADEHVDGLMKFTQNFAIPCLLFRAISTLDLAQDFDLRAAGSASTPARPRASSRACSARATCSAGRGRTAWRSASAGSSPTRCCWACRSPNAPMAPGALAGNYAIIALHSPFCYGSASPRWRSPATGGGGCGATAQRVLQAMFSQRAGDRHRRWASSSTSARCRCPASSPTRST